MVWDCPLWFITPTNKIFFSKKGTGLIKRMGRLFLFLLQLLWQNLKNLLHAYY